MEGWIRRGGDRRGSGKPLEEGEAISAASM